MRGLMYDTKKMYIEAMFEVLVFVYENYWRGDACPELQQLGRKLSAAGFEYDDIQQALQWLDGLNIASQHTELIDIGQSVPEQHTESGNSLRIYSVAEQDHLGAACWVSSTFWSRPKCCHRTCAKSCSTVRWQCPDTPCRSTI